MLEMAGECGKFIGYLAVIFASFIGIRFLYYYHNFFLRWPRYRQLRLITSGDLEVIPHTPFVKIQITTRGLPDSTRVIRRGIQFIIKLAREAPQLYADKLGISVKGGVRRWLS